MLQVVLGFLGYVKIPLSVVQLSIQQEEFLRKLQEIATNPKSRALFGKYLNGQESMTRFLRAGRKISG